MTREWIDTSAVPPDSTSYGPCSSPNDPFSSISVRKDSDACFGRSSSGVIGVKGEEVVDAVLVDMSSDPTVMSVDPDDFRDPTRSPLEGFDVTSNLVPER
jgi:hypothetical protein